MYVKKMSKPTAQEKAQAKREAQEWARDMVSRDLIFIDTETDSFPWEDPDCQCLQFTATSLGGFPLLNTVVRPSRNLGYNKAWEIHGIGEENWRLAPSFAELAGLITGLLQNRTVIIYNKAFDMKVLELEFGRTGIAMPEFDSQCAMLAYAKYEGKWNPSKNGWKWPRLPALSHSGSAHDSMTDCLSTAAVVKRMAGQEPASGIDLSF